MPCFAFQLLGFLCVCMSTGQARKHILVSKGLTYSEAKLYCETNYTSLSPILTQWDLDAINSFRERQDRDAWIGLMRGHQNWKWIRGTEPTFYVWHQNPTGCGAIESGGFWGNYNCESNLPYFCQTEQGQHIRFRNKKTWEGAWKHCKNKGHMLTNFRNRDTKMDPWPNTPHWIALKSESGDWHWVVGGSNRSTEGLSSTNWKTKGLCAYMNPDGSWSDSDCFQHFWFVCQDGDSYQLFKIASNWFKARDFCRQNNTHLVEIHHISENVMLNYLYQGATYWIGLSDNPWQWPDGSYVELSHWKEGDPDDPLEDKSCVSTLNGLWSNTLCSNKLPFFCLSEPTATLKLVIAHFSWLKAMQHCQNIGGNLATVGKELSYRGQLKVAQQTNSTNVWVGLRFLMGEWLWVNGHPVHHQRWANTETCPLHHCGSLNQEIKAWVPTNCNEKLPFLCQVRSLR